LDFCVWMSILLHEQQAKIFKAVFAEPASPSIECAAIESLMLAVGCTLIEGHGSRVRFECKGVIAAFHRPHPAKEAKRYQVRDARAFLEKLGITP